MTSQDAETAPEYDPCWRCGWEVGHRSGCGVNHDAEHARVIAALTKALIRVHERTEKRLPTVPIGTRVTTSEGVGTVVGRDGYGFDGVAVILDHPRPGYEDGVCTGADDCVPTPPGSGDRS